MIHIRRLKNKGMEPCRCRLCGNRHIANSRKDWKVQARLTNYCSADSFQRSPELRLLREENEAMKMTEADVVWVLDREWNRDMPNRGTVRVVRRRKSN